MKEQVKKAMYAGLGLASIAFDKVKDLGNELADEFDLSHEEGEKLAEEISKKAKEEKERISKLIDEKVEKNTAKINAGLKDEIEKLKERLDKMEAKLK